MTNNKNDWREEFDKFVIRLGNELPIIEEADDGDIERWLTECKAFIAQTRKDAVEEALESVHEEILSMKDLRDPHTQNQKIINGHHLVVWIQEFIRQFKDSL